MLRDKWQMAIYVDVHLIHAFYKTIQHHYWQCSSFYFLGICPHYCYLHIYFDFLKWFNFVYVFV